MLKILNTGMHHNQLKHCETADYSFSPYTNSGGIMLRSLKLKKQKLSNGLLGLESLSCERLMKLEGMKRSESKLRGLSGLKELAL